MQDSLASPLPIGADDLPVIDLEAFQTITSVLGTSRATRMAATFFADAERRLEALDRDETSAADLQEHAHALLSMAGHFGLRRLSALCMDLQERARRNDGLADRPMLRRSVDEARAAVTAVVGHRALGDPTATNTRPARAPGWVPSEALATVDGGRGLVGPA